MIRGEFKRQLWLNVSLQKLIVIPLVLAFILYITGFKDMLLMDDSDKKHLIMISLISGSIFGYFVFIVLWGCKSISESIADEVRDRTWDWQRLSSQSPFKLMLGKFFGAPIMAWYGGLLCLGCAILLYTQLPESFFGSKFEQTNDAFWIFILSSVLVTLLVHSLTFSSALGYLSSENGTVRKGQSGLHIIISAVICWIVLSMILGTFNWKGISSYSGVRISEPTNTNWFNMRINSTYFWVASLAFFTFWAFWGCCRLVAKEFGKNQYPIAWLLFIVSLMIYLTGLQTGLISSRTQYKLSKILNTPINHAMVVSMHAFVFSIFAVYIGLLGSSLRPIHYHRWVTALKKKHYKRMLQSTPLWTVSLFVALMQIPLFFLFSYFSSTPIPLMLICSTLLFLLRDVFLILFLLFSLTRYSRASSYAVLYLVFLYVLVPMVVIKSSSMGHRFSFDEIKEVLGVFYPSKQNIALSILVPGLQAFATFTLMRKGWKKIYG